MAAPLIKKNIPIATVEHGNRSIMVLGENFFFKDAGAVRVIEISMNEEI